jgi:hypothetical protein
MPLIIIYYLAGDLVVAVVAVGGTTQRALFSPVDLFVTFVNRTARGEDDVKVHELG